MARTDRVGKHATTISQTDKRVTVCYHDTVVFEWNIPGNLVTLRSGGWETVSTKTRINQAFNQFGLPLTLYQEKGVWFVQYRSDGEVIKFEDGMSFRPLRDLHASD